MMHACFHGGGSGSRITKSVAVIRDLTKSMKAMTLKVKGGGGANRARARRRRRKPTTGDEELQLDASSSASSSAKIAPAQPHEDEHDGGGEKHEHCDKCCSPLTEEEEGTAPADASDGEWMAEPEPGVLMTLAPRGDGANYLRRIRFSEDHFPDAWAAQAWWADNCDRIVELYSVVVPSECSSHGGGDEEDPVAPVTPCQSEDEEHQRPDGELEYSASCSASASASASGGSTSNFSGPSSGSGSANKVDSPILGLVTEPNSSKRSPQAQHNQKKSGPVQ
ncbi:hypothetical protein EJB05_39146 [Eragrostis curvula]|uniref:BRX domain-containing protein n=1 Tax=Eragrostis curvula TaxID=38414 RepID=A0A5J9TW70_9POAL|nr:hypothetical protein EJB05_39146 [Eragrostis curvula]